MAVNPTQRKKYFDARAAGFSIAQSAKKAGFSEATAYRIEKAAKTVVQDIHDDKTGAATHRERVAENKLQGPKSYESLSPEAKRALEDFQYFRRRYFGRISTPWQEEAGYALVNFLESPEKEYVVMNMPPGSGKGEWVETPIPTPTGWTTMGELKVGDTIFDDQGKPTTVVFKSEVKYLDCYEVTTDDGHTVVVDGDHLWSANIDRKHLPKFDRPGKTGPKPKRSPDGFSLYDTRTLAKRRSKRPLIPVAKPLELPDADLPIEPYTLGLWLGDGTSAGASFTADDNDAAWLIPELQRLNPQYDVHACATHQRFSITGGFKRDLDNANLTNNKHVPAQYLRASACQRLALLQGLIDSDGYVSETGHIEFCNTNIALAEAVQELALSLGVKASLRTGRSMLNGVDHGTKYRVTFYLKDAARIPRKAERTRNGERTPGRYLSIVPIGTVPTQCIQVDSPSKLFLSGHGFVVSHNTTLLHDLTCWIICRNRQVRLLTGSATMTLAKRNLMRVKRSLERIIPEVADDNLKARGLAVDAESTMAHDFGRFKPLDKELWTNEAFIVMQPEDAGAISEKEPTLSAFGMDSGFIGSRVDGCFWDDLVDPRKVRSSEQREAMEDWWQDVAESRLEPGGMLALIGQRLAPDDLYRFALDMLQPLDDEDEDRLAEMSDEEIATIRRDKKYHHLIYKAHYEDRCKPENHKISSSAYPEGCLLDPRRISWRDVSNLMSNRGERFQVVYQQEDIALDEVLVKNEWVFGHGDSPGCIDKDRDRWELPYGMNARDCFIVATADPSPTNYWSIQCWAYHPDSNQRFLLDLIRSKMDANEFLDYNIAEGRYTGIMEDWQRLSETLGMPIQYWIVEQNAAQRFMLQYDTVKQWRQINGVEILGHNTSSNKSDPDYGVTTISQHYRFGRVRLMGKGEGKTRSMKLIDEVTRYPHGRTDDCVMAQWFFEWNLPNLYLPRTHTVQAWRPGWVKKTNLANLR